MGDRGNDDLVQLSGEIAAAYVTRNPLSPSGLPDLLKSIHRALAATVRPSEPVPSQLSPAVPIRKSVTPEAIVCLECAKTFKSLRRHLQASHSFTPLQYRERWGLPADYPMVAPDYAAMRSGFARSMGLGRKGSGPDRRRRKK